MLKDKAPDSELITHLRDHGWALLEDSKEGLELSTAVTEQFEDFFSQEAEQKKPHKQSCPGKIGKLHMWRWSDFNAKSLTRPFHTVSLRSVGYSKQRVREQFHIVVVSTWAAQKTKTETTADSGL